ncbi:MAG: hypothetical protein AAF567_15420 [Actinomycetota bacterium]
MGLEVTTQDCTAVTDAELEEMADLVAEGPNPFSVGLLSKQTELWVLCTTARENGKLRGYAFSTLERIGGTPSVLVGLGAVVNNGKRSTVLRGLMSELYHRALMAFPDEDVLFGAQFNDASGFEAYKELTDLIPRPDYKPNGEERAWGRRLAKRFQIGNSKYDDRAFKATGDGSQASVLDYTALDPSTIDADVAAMFADIDASKGDSMVAHGWVSPERLVKLGS